MEDDAITNLDILLKEFTLNTVNKEISSNDIQIILSDKYLGKIPEKINFCINLEYLNLSKNEIEIIPEFIKDLTKLKKFNISFNKIKKIPDFIDNLQDLQELKINENPIEYIPKTINNLNNLVNFSMGSKKFISSNITDIVNTLNLRKLQKFYCYETEIENIPENFKNFDLDSIILSDNKISIFPKILFECKQIFVISINNNQINEIPNNLSNLSNLQILDLSHNQIEKIPDNLSNLSNLQILDLSHNQIEKIPDNFNIRELKSLALNNNVLREIPYDLGNLVNLEILYIHNNKISILPLSLINLRKLKRFEFICNPIENTNIFIQRFLQKFYIGLSLNNTYTDSQNVHTSSIQQSIANSIIKILSCHY